MSVVETPFGFIKPGDRGKDGLDHINVYLRGATPLGQFLTNPANTPFTLNGLDFRSGEGWWYWKITGDHRCRYTSGLDGKRFCQSLLAPHHKSVIIPKEDLLEMYKAKLASNPRIKGLMLLNRLPYDHYYVYGGKIVETKWRWTGQLWNQVKNEMG